MGGVLNELARDRNPRLENAGDRDQKLRAGEVEETRDLNGGRKGKEREEPSSRIPVVGIAGSDRSRSSTLEGDDWGPNVSSFERMVV